MATAMAVPEAVEQIFTMPTDEQLIDQLAEHHEREAATPTDQEEFDTLVKSARTFGTQYGAPYFKAETTFSKAFADNVDDFIRLREMFPKQGSHATRTVDGKEYTWKTFCLTFLYITPERFGQLTRQLRPDPNKDKPEPRAQEDTPAYRAGYQKGRAEAEVPAAIEEDVKDKPEEDLEESSDHLEAQTGVTDVLAYFAPYKKDPMSFAAELQAIVRHYGLARKITIELI